MGGVCPRVDIREEEEMGASPGGGPARLASPMSLGGPGAIGAWAVGCAVSSGGQGPRYHFLSRPLAQGRALGRLSEPSPQRCPMLLDLRKS